MSIETDWSAEKPDLSNIPEDDRLDTWPWSKQYENQINEDFAKGSHASMLQMLDSIGVPRGTYSDDRLLNFIVMYNRRGDMITSLQAQFDECKNENKLLISTLADIANWPPLRNDEGIKSLKTVAASVIDPTLVKSLNILYDNT